jgi:hypothetical protein
MSTRPVIPHSWSLSTWPATVWPHTVNKGRYQVRHNMDELLKAGALARVGRELIVLGERYARWLEKKTSNVPGYQIPPNSARAAENVAA